jgi:uncharacterized metal-binding protein YceD (DUF177 family)
MAKENKLAHTVELQDVRDSHKVVLDIRATPDECLALAKRCDILEIKDLNAHIVLNQGGRSDLFRITGELQAHVVQACGVNGSPVKEAVAESFNEVLTTDPTALAAEDETDDDVEQPVELIENDKLDLGEIITQWLVLSLNPFPRSDAPAFEHIEQIEGVSGERMHTPFSVLENLKKK